MKKKVLFINLPYYGHIACTLKLVKELIKRNYEVAYITSPKHQSLIEQTGAEFIPYIDFDVNLNSSEESNKAYYAAYRTGLEVGRAYDLVIYDMCFFLGENLIKRLNKPAIREFPTIAIDNEICEYLLNISPDWFPWKSEEVAKQTTAKWSNGVKTKTGHGYREIAQTKSDINIVYTTREFQPFIENFDNTYHFVGPSINQMDVNLNIPFSLMSYPIIYISLGTMFNNNLSFFLKCIDAFKGKKFDLILAVGNGIDIKEFGEPPSNVHIYKFVPQDLVMERACLFISHCGMNSINEAMMYGIPILAAPILWDELINAEQIEKIGIGKKIDIMNADSECIYNVATRIIGNKSIGDRAKNMKTIISNYTGAIAAADIVEEYIN